MIGAMFFRLLRQQRGLILAIVAGVALLEALLVWVASNMEQGPGFLAIIEQILPETMRKIVTSQFAIAGFSGMIGFGFQHPLVMVASIAFVIVAATIPAGERETGFIELILARPLPRRRYLTAVVLLVALGAIVMPAAVLAALAVGLALVEGSGELSWTRYLASAGGLTVLLLAVGGYTLVLAVGARRRGSAAAGAVGITLALYAVDVTAQIWEPLQTVQWLSPFAYYRPIQAAVIPDTPIENPIVLISIFIVGLVAAFARFQRQDL